METNESQTVSLMNDLIRINNDRIEGYERATNDTDDTDLKSLFNVMAQESRKFRNELITEVIRMGGTPADGTTVSGKIFRAWMDFKAAVAGKKRSSIIASCESGEEAALETYKDVMNSGKLPSRYFTTIKEQENGLKRSHERIKAMHEEVKVF